MIIKIGWCGNCEKPMDAMRDLLTNDWFCMKCGKIIKREDILYLVL